MQKTTPRLSRRTALGVFGAALALPHAALGAQFSTLAGNAFGTTWRLVTPTGTDLASIRKAIESLFAGIDRTFSPWRADSALARFNALPAGQDSRDKNLAEVTAAALDIALQSDGAFDPTVGPLVARWGFGPILDGGPPDWRGITAAQGSLSKSRNDLTLDLCGIAKGWALDRAAMRVANLGIDSFLFELGGEILVRGQHPDGRDWRVAVDMPGAFASAATAMRLPSGTAIATSGQWIQSYRLADRLYGHIIDPRTAEPVDGALLSVSVVAGDAMSADAWATALCAAGAEAGPDLARSRSLTALFLIEKGSRLRTVVTGALRELTL